MTTGVYGQQGSTTTADEYNTLAFVFWTLMQKVQTCTLVEVLSCTNDGGLAPIGMVTVQPCVNQMTGNRQAVPHGEIFNLLYSRIAGGRNAVIMDPEEGDIGMMNFCSRDISGVIANKGPANPGSFRMFDWADGIYTIGVPMGVTPNQYIQFNTDGVVVVSPTKITLQAPLVEIDATTVNINGSSAVNVTAPEVGLDASITAVVTSPAIVLDGDTTIDGALAQTPSSGSATLGPLVADSVKTVAGIDLDTHKQGPGTYTAGSTAVTGDSGNPI